MAARVRLSSPDKVYFPAVPATKGDVFAYYEAVAAAMLEHLRDRPIVLKRWPDGIERPSFFQKRAPSSRPDWVQVATYTFPSGRTADEVVIDGQDALLWCVQLGNIEFHAHPLRAQDLDHPDELRVDLDPGPGVAFADVRTVALLARDVLAEHGLLAFAKTSGSRGLHVYAPIAARWPFDEVRRAALALAREVERRAPALATSRWWKEERHGVFVDFNQNARDRTMAAAFSLRARPAATVSMPVAWEEVATVEPEAFTIRTVPEILAAGGDPSRPIRERAGAQSLDALLDLAARQERDGNGDAPLPPFHSRRGTAPLRIVARAQDAAAAHEGLQRWRKRHPEAARHLREDDVLVDSMRGRSSTWTRIRVNLRHVPPALRPRPEPPDPDLGA